MQPTIHKASRSPNFWRVAFGSFWVPFGATWFVVGAVFLSIGLSMIVGEWRYRTDGVTSKALVTNRERRGKDYRIDYRFDTPHGRVDGSSQVPLEMWRKLQVNGPVVVIYRAHNPSSNRAQGQNNWVLIAISTPLGAFFFSMGSLLLVKSLSDLPEGMPQGAEGSTRASEGG
jgi:hypothetical protein